MPPNPLARVRTICLALPEAHEVEAWGEATFRVRNKLFAMYASAGSHHGGGRPAIWIKAAAGNQSLMLQFAPQRFFVPPYVGPSGWVGVWLDEVVQWAELEELLRDAYLLTAPKRVAARLDAPAPETPPSRDGAGATSKAAASKSAPRGRATGKRSTAKPERPSAKRRPSKGVAGERAAAKGGANGAKEAKEAKRAKRAKGAKRSATRSSAKRGAKKPSARKRRG